MPWILERRYWLGRHATKGPILVSGPIQAGDRIMVFFVDEDRWVDCDRAIMKEKLMDDLPDDLVRRVTQDLLAKLEEEVKSKHLTYLKNRNLSAAGTEKRSDASPQRFTHCWRCKSNINSVTLLECCGCGWILCNCGACGCGYTP